MQKINAEGLLSLKLKFTSFEYSLIDKNEEITDGSENTAEGLNDDVNNYYSSHRYNCR